MKKWVLPTKSIDKENIQYEWVAESGACEVCQGMDGTIYDSANDIPDRPHPNCKCHIEIIEKDSDEPISDPIEARREERAHENRLKMEVAELFGHTKSLMEEIDEFLNQVNTEEHNYLEFQQNIDITQLKPEDKQEFTKAFEELNYAKYRGEKIKNDLTKLQTENIVLEGKIKILNIPLIVLEKTLEVLAGTFRVMLNIAKELIYVAWKTFTKKQVLANIALKILANGYGEYHTNKYKMPEAKNLYKVGSPEYLHNRKYVEQNGELYDSINELHNYQQEKDIHSRIKAEMGLKDCKVLKLKSNSSLAKEIEKSNAIKKFLNDYGKRLENGEIIQQSKVTFESNDTDLYSAIHGGVFKNAYIDKSTKILHISVEDFWNFELRSQVLKLFWAGICKI